MQEMLHAKGINWNDYPDFFKRGTFVLRRKITMRLTAEELASIPPLHRPEEGKEYERTGFITTCLPPLLKISNRVDVLFRGADLIMEEQ
jgi:hypothetical protein